jgi:hypothetical protein
MSSSLVFLTVHRVLTSRPNILSCGFPKIAPPLTFTLRVRSRILPKESSLSRHCYMPSIFRPCRSSRLRRFTPRTAPQAYCILQPVMGFEPFPVGPPFHCVTTSVGPPRFSQARSSHPSKLFPLRKPCRVTAAVAISLLSCPVVSNWSVAQSHGLALPENPLSNPCVSTCAQPVAPLGLVPLQGAPLIPTVHLDSPGANPPQRRRSGSRSPK